MNKNNNHYKVVFKKGKNNKQIQEKTQNKMAKIKINCYQSQ